MRKGGKLWDEIGAVFGTSGENVRAWAKKQERFDEIREEHKVTNAVKETFETKSIAEDGKITTEIKKKLNEKITYEESELLELHGLNGDEFTIRNITSNEWSMTNAEGQQYYNFQSKIIAEPKTQEITPEFIANLFESVKPQEIELNLDEVPRTYLLIPLSDFHWGLNYAEDYAQLKRDIKDLIIEGYSEILFVLNGDYFHV